MDMRFPLRVLVVDDSKTICQLMSKALSSMGTAHHAIAHTGEEAIVCIRDEQVEYDLIFVDLNMPVLDGMQLLQFLAGYRFPGSVVILSSLDAKVIKIAASLAGEYGLKLAGCIEKPIDPNKIESMLDHVLQYQLPSASGHYCKQIPLEYVTDALNHTGIIPYYQPKVNLKNNTVKGLEVLARIRKPNGLELDVFPASEFITIVEESNLSHHLLMAVLEQTLKDMPAIRQEFGKDIIIAVNISPKDLLNGDLPLQLSDLLDYYKAKPSEFIIEVTESVAIENPSQLDTLNRLRIKGFGLSLDDFGTGYTNIHQLRDLPYNEVKLDRSLAHNVCKDKLTRVISESLFGIFSELSLDVVVEGIEAQSDVNFFDDIGYPVCFQGFAISEPKDLKDILHWHQSWQRILNRDKA